MSMWARVKTMLGSKTPLTTLASATTLNIPDSNNCFLVSGTATITSLVSADFIRNRAVTFIGAAGCTVTFTNTNTPVVDQMYLHNQNRTILEDDVIELFCKDNGAWLLLNLVN